MSITREQLDSLKAFAEGQCHTYDMAAIKAAVEALERLPCTADGVPVMPGMTVYKFYGRYSETLKIQGWDNTKVGEVGPWLQCAECAIPAAEVYSTLEAAEAARGGEDG